jgi:hypothetical protein
VFSFFARDWGENADGEKRGKGIKIAIELNYKIINNLAR